VCVGCGAGRGGGLRDLIRGPSAELLEDPRGWRTVSSERAGRGEEVPRRGLGLARSEE